MLTALHVSNGDCTEVPGTGLASRVIYWRDSLHEGPVPAVDPEELRRIRAAFLVEAGVDDRAEGAGMFVERDSVLAANRDGEYVLWFEADLYDQLQIIQILDRLAGLGVPAQRITLICIGEYPGIARFGGLGELTAEQLRELPATKACARLTPAALRLATQAWAAFCAPTPEGLRAMARNRSGELRFLGEAFDRLCREYPSTRDGLSLTERRILAAVAAGTDDGDAVGGGGVAGRADDGTGSGRAVGGGAVEAGTAFVRAAARETRPFLGDTWCFAMMERMASCAVPLLHAEPSERPVARETLLRLTAAGARVLAGKADHLTLNGIDRWIGGVHLRGHHVPWRWDDAIEALTQALPRPAPQWTLGGDATDPRLLARFWAGALGYVAEPGYDDPDGASIIDPAGVGPAIGFLRVPEPKTAKNRVHIDIRMAGEPPWDPVEHERLVRAKVAELLAAGATFVREDHYGDEFGHIVMLDPEGNEFCVA